MSSTDDAKQTPTQEKASEQPVQLGDSLESTHDKGVVAQLKKHLTSEIRIDILAETELLVLTFCTGIQDATTFPDYHCFASNQTGNTVMLAMAVLLPEVTNELFVTKNIGVSLGFFLAAGWITGQLSHVIGPRSRLWIVFCNLLQTVLVFIAAAIQYEYGVQLESTKTMIVVGFLAFAAGSQVVLSRSLAITEISTAMATAAWVDLLIDQKLFAVHNRARTRRVGFLAALVAGAFFGAYVYRSLGSATAILFSGVGKLIVTVVFLFNGTERPKGSESIV